MTWTAWLFRRSQRRVSASLPRRSTLQIESLELRDVPASIAGNVFRDFNNNGTLNGPDAAISGVTVSVSGGALTTPVTATTDTSGNFSLTGLAAGTYTLTATPPTGTVAGKSTAGSPSGTGGTTGTITAITLTENQDATGYRFGVVPNALTTGGTIFNDANGNGTRDTGEVGIAGVTVTLTGTSILTGAAITAKTATTDANGAYNFSALTPGTYSIAAGVKAGFARGTLQNGTPAAASTTGGVFTGIDLTSTADVSANFNFADVTPTTLSLTQTVSATSVKAGDRVTITIVAENTGTRSVDNVMAMLNLDSLSYVSSTGTGYVPATRTWTIGTLDAEETATLTIVATVPSRGVFQPTSRLFATETAPTAGQAVLAADVAADVVGDTAFSTIAARATGVSMQNFLVSTLNAFSITGAGSSSAPVFAGPSNTLTPPTTPTVTFFNAAGTTQLTGASTTEATTTIKGVTSANATVTLVQTGETTTASASGAYTFSAVPVVVGANSFTVRAGTGTNTSQRTASVTRTSVTAPTAPTVTFFNAAGTTQLTGASTTEATTTIKGVTSANATVTLVQTGATTTANASGAYTFSAVPVVVGSNSFTVRAGTASNTSQTTASVTRTSSTAPTVPTVTFFNAAGTTQLGGSTTAETATTIKGATSANTIVTLVGTSLTTTSDNTGNYSLAGVPLTVGTNSFTVRAGTGSNTSQTTATLTRTTTTVTETVPAAPTVSFFNTAGTTALSSGNTNVGTTVIKGVTTPNTTVTLDETNATTTSDSAGNYTFTAVPVVVDLNTFTVIAGTGENTSQTTSTLIGNDVATTPTRPTVSFFNAANETALAGTSTNEGSVTLRGTTSPNTDLVLVSTGAITTADDAGAYAFTDVPVIVGANSYTVRAGSGAASSSTTVTLTGTATAATPTAPTVVFFNAAGETQLAGTTTNESLVVLNGVTSPNATVTLAGTVNSTVADETGAYSIVDVQVVVGTNTLVVQATGEDGTTRQTTRTLTGTATAATPTAPTVTFFDASGEDALTGGTTSEITTTIKGVTSPNASLTLAETADSATADATGAYTFSSVPVAVGSNTYTVIAAGTDGTARKTVGTLTGTTAAPTPVPISPTVRFFNGTTPLTGGTTMGATVTVRGVTSPNTTVTLLLNGDTTTSDGTGAYSFSDVDLTVGGNTLIVQAGTDGAISQTTSTLERVSPTPTTPTTPTLLLFRADGTTQITTGTSTEATTVIRGVTSPNTPLTLTQTGATTTSDGTGAYTFTNVPVAVGSNTYTVTAGTGTATSQASSTLTRTAGTASNTAPTIASQQAAVTLATSAGTTIDLAGNFTDAQLGITKVKLTTSLGDVNIDLFAKDAPRTVANFLNYIADGKYTNSIFHRSVAGFVLQGGGFAFDVTDEREGAITTIATDPAVQNEPDTVNRSNLRGTLAMAKLGGNPNSATSQFFFNLANNAANLDAQNGGFTVFGRVSSAADQAVVDALAALPTQDQSEASDLPANQQGIFGDIPLRSYRGANFPTDATLANFAAITGVTIVDQPEVLTYSIVSNSNAATVTATLAENRLTVTKVAGQTGTATITVRATDKAGLTTDMTFTVTAS
jgi:cyclophilin family peptidyl-prolyl cis-trans isomerase